MQQASQAQWEAFFSLLYNYNVRGLRFQPTELELMEYLQEHIAHQSVNPLVIPQVDLNRVDPQEIPGLCQVFFPGDKHQWYLFHSCPRLYTRTDNRRENRKTPQGHWKGTGKPTNVLDRQGNTVGTRKTLVFYIGKSGSSCKTDWILHEFRIDGPSSAPASPVRLFLNLPVCPHFSLHHGFGSVMLTIPFHFMNRSKQQKL